MSNRDPLSPPTAHPAHPTLDDVLAWSRRRFLRVSAGSALALGACVNSQGEDVVPTGAGGKLDNLEFDENGVCLSGATHNDALGPYWTPNIKNTIQLATPGELGQRMVVMGHVYARDCT